MISFPNAKINLGLNVVHKREDGYHDLETVFFPVKINDALEVIRSAVFKFTCSGLSIEGAPEQNLCVKAYNLLREDYPEIPPVHVHLHKNIPMGAGLGGGSADAAFLLMLLNNQFNLNISQERLLAYALALGSDCPFFIYNTPCFATGRGERLEPIDLDLSTYRVVLVNPSIHISTKMAFSKLSPSMPAKSVKEIVRQPVETWQGELKNDFEKTVFNNYPEINRIKQELYHHGAVYASMTGSGSSVYGLFKKSNEGVFFSFKNYPTFIF